MQRCRSSSSSRATTPSPCTAGKTCLEQLGHPSEGICSSRSLGDGHNPKARPGETGRGSSTTSPVAKPAEVFPSFPWFLFASAGAGRTGTFCALSTVLERVKAEAILDVFQTVKSLRLQRPHMVQTLVGASCPSRTSARTGWGLSVEQKPPLVQGFHSP